MGDLPACDLSRLRTAVAGAVITGSARPSVPSRMRLGPFDHRHFATPWQGEVCMNTEGIVLETFSGSSLFPAVDRPCSGAASVLYS